MAVKTAVNSSLPRPGLALSGAGCKPRRTWAWDSSLIFIAPMHLQRWVRIKKIASNKEAL
jgi:hypothetical protein